MKETEVIDMVPVIVAGKKVMVPKNLKVGDLKKAGQIPEDRSLVLQRGETKKVVKDSDKLKVEQDDIFSDIPQYEVGNQDERILLEVSLLRNAFNEVEYDSERLLWVCIHDFKLPQGFNKGKTGLLIELPKNYPFCPPKNCFLDKTIKTALGKEIREHYYPDKLYNKYYDKGWAWFCIHIKSWKIRDDVMESDNLLTSIDIAYLTLENLVKNSD